MDAATKFLNDKRKEQKTKEKSMMLVIAPSMASRYGMDDMGGYSLQSGKYTGAGLDGAVEPDLPTERRQASNGQPYGVDEGEVVVNDAATVAAYGGAQALDAFIQAHRPDGQQRNPNQPQQNMAKDLNAQGVPRFSIGGLPSMKPVIKPTTFQQPGVGVDVGASSAIAATNPIPSMQEAATNSTISKSVNDILFGNKTATTPALVPQPVAVPPVAVPQLRDRSVAAPAPVISPVSLFAPTESIVPPVRQTVTPAPAIATPPPAQQVITSETPPTATTAAATAPAIATPPPAQQVITSATPLTATTAAPAPAIATLPPGQPVPIPTPAAANGPQTYSANNVDEMILNRYMDRLGGMNESERAAEEQRLMQQGIPKTTIDAAIAQSDVGRRSAEGQAVAQYATDAAGRALQQNQFNRTQGLAETEYMNQQTDKAWNDALNSYDPRTLDGLKALQDIYVKNHPGQPAPDMNSLIDQRTLVKQALAGGAQALATNDWNAAVLTYNPATPAGLKALQDLYAQQHPGMPVPDLDVLIEQRKYQQSLQTINVDSLKTKLGQDKFDTLKARMDAGMTYETYAPIAAQFGTVLNKQEFDAMRQYSAAGVADWNKQLSGVQLLLSTGGTGNIANAASQLNTMFSGLGIDFSGKITEENQVKFATGMSNLTKLATSGAKYADVKNALTQAGVFTDLGLNEKDVQAMFEQQVLMKDPLYRSAYAISDSSIQTMYPEATTPEAIQKIRAAYAKMSSTGVLKINADGTFAPDMDLLETMFGEDWMIGKRDEIAKEISYADYSAAATAAGETPKSEVAWRGGGGGAFVPAGSITRGTKGYTFPTTAEADTAWQKYKSDAADSNDQSAMDLTRSQWTNLGSPEMSNYSPFVPESTYDASANPQASTFAEGGGYWSGPGQTQPIVDGQKISIKGGNATVQNSSIVVPVGDYTVGTFGSLKTLTNFDTGKTYVIVGTGGNTYGEYVIKDGLATTTKGTNGYLLKSNTLVDVNGKTFEFGKNYSDKLVQDKNGNTYRLIISSNGQQAYTDMQTGTKAYIVTKDSDGNIVLTEKT